MSHQLDSTDLELLIILQEKPVANDSTLARLVNLSSPTIKRRLDKLHDVKAVERIQALLNYKALGLEVVSLYASVPYPKLQTVQSLLKKHPYIYYCIRCVGSTNGVHATFRIPHEGIPLVGELCKILKAKGCFTDYTLQTHHGEGVRAKPRFAVYNSKTNSWDFEFTRWAEVPPERLLRGLDEDIGEVEPAPSLSELDLVDVEILSVLSLNSRIKNVDILERINHKVSPQRLSDRLRFLKKHFIRNYRVFLNWDEIFQLVGFSFVCKASEETTTFFSTLIKYRPPPFECTLRMTDDGFVFNLICPPSHVHSAINVLDARVKEVQTHLFDYKTGERFGGLNTKVFDENQRAWVVSREEMVEKLTAGI